MSPALRDHIVACDREVQLWAGVSARREHRSGHIAVVLSFRGRERRVWMAGTPSDSRCGLQNHLRDIRHALRELGAERQEQSRTAHVRNRNRTEPARPFQPTAPISHKPDRWLSQLALIKQRLETA